MIKTVIFTGGGTAGHVLPNLVICRSLDPKTWRSLYIGSYMGIERDLVAELMPYYPISSGKLRRYFDLKNFTDIFRVFRGAVQAYFLLGKLKPNVLFSKGGFVSVPVAVAAWMRGIPVVAHESDYSPGLSNRLIQPFSAKLCVAFSETLTRLSPKKTVLTGIPIRTEILHGDPGKGYSFTGFSPNEPILFVMGGSLGAEFINSLIRDDLSELLKTFQIIHLCGTGKLDEALSSLPGYKQFEYVSEELPHLLAISSLIISRAGANSLFELLALKKPHLLIPLSLNASRGDQILNAGSFEKKGYSRVVQEENFSAGRLRLELSALWEKRESYQENMRKSPLLNSADLIKKVLEDLSL